MKKLSDIACIKYGVTNTYLLNEKILIDTD